MSADNNVFYRVCYLSPDRRESNQFHTAGTGTTIYCVQLQFAAGKTKSYFVVGEAAAYSLKKSLDEERATGVKVRIYRLDSNYVPGSEARAWTWPFHRDAARVLIARDVAHPIHSFAGNTDTPNEAVR
jgi:hypothetical protein